MQNESFFRLSVAIQRFELNDGFLLCFFLYLNSVHTHTHETIVIIQVTLTEFSCFPMPSPGFKPTTF